MRLAVPFGVGAKPRADKGVKLSKLEQKAGVWRPEGRRSRQ
jgi:hypothetical protein